MIFLNNLSRAGHATLVTVAVLFVIFAATFGWVWQRLPAEGVKLHANIDTGVDVFGDRSELLWLLASVMAVVMGNLLLAALLRRTQPLAAAMLVGTLAPLVVGFTGALVFIASLNTPR